MDIQFEKSKWIEDSDGTWFCLLIKNYKDIKKVKEFVQTMKNAVHVLTVKLFREKRSLDANAYSWVLTDKLADVLGKGKEEMHIEMLREYGQTAVDDEGNKIIFSVKSGIKFEKAYRYVKVIGSGMVNGEEYTHYKALKGSSEFDSKEMSLFIKGIIYECELVNEDLPITERIEIRTPDEIARMNALWGKEK